MEYTALNLIGVFFWVALIALFYQGVALAIVLYIKSSTWMIAIGLITTGVIAGLGHSGLTEIGYESGTSALTGAMVVAGFLAGYTRHKQQPRVPSD